MDERHVCVKMVENLTNPRGEAWTSPTLRCRKRYRLEAIGGCVAPRAWPHRLRGRLRTRTIVFGAEETRVNTRQVVHAGDNKLPRLADAKDMQIQHMRRPLKSHLVTMQSTAMPTVSCL